MRCALAAVLAAMVVGSIVTPAAAAPEDDVRAALDALLEAAGSGDSEAFGALLSDDGFLFVDGTGYGDAVLLGKDACVQFVAQNAPGGGMSFAEADIQVRGAVAGTVAAIRIPGEGSMPCVSVLSQGEDEAWKLNVLALMPGGSETGAGAKAIGDTLTAMQTAIEGGDAAAAIAGINADPFVAVVGLPTGESMVMADSTILTLIFSQMAGAGDAMTLEWSAPEVFGNASVGCAHLTIKVDAGEMMQADTEALFVAARVNGKWVLPAGAMVVEVPEGALDEELDGDEEAEAEADEQ